jgi:hypothetical protein
VYIYIYIYIYIHIFTHTHTHKSRATTTPSKDANNMTPSAQQTPSNSRTYTGPDTLDESVAKSCPYIFGGFSRTSKVRIRCFKIYQSGVWATFFTIVMVANSVCIAITPEFYSDDHEETHHAAPVAFEVFDVFSVLMLFFECAVGIIGIGFCAEPSTWLQCSDFHKLDMIMVGVTVLEGIAILAGVNTITFRAFRLLRVFRAVTMIKTFIGIKTIIQTLKQGVSQLAMVFLMLVFFMLAFSVFGMAIFQNSFQRRCLTLPRLVPACASDFTTGWAQTCDFASSFSSTSITAAAAAANSTNSAYIYSNQQQQQQMVLVTEPQIAIPGGYPYEIFCKIIANSTPGEYDGEYPLDPFGRYHTCQMDEFHSGLPVTAYCENTGVNPSNGFAHFDHIAGAMMNIFQATAVDGYYDVLHRSLQSEPTHKAITWLYYFLISCLNTFLLLGLFVAIVTGTFNRVRLKQGTAFRDVEAMQVLQEVIKRFNTKARRTGDNKKSDKDGADRPRRSFELPRISRGSDKARQSMDFSQLKSPHRRAVQMLPGYKRPEKSDKERQAAIRVLRQSWLKHFVSLVIIGHAYCMGSDQYYSTSVWHTGMIFADIGCNVVFLAETFLRFTAAGTPRTFWRSKLARFELCMIVFGVAGITTGSHILRLVPALRIYRLMVYLPTLSSLLNSAVSSVKAILNLILFITIVAICFGVSGRYVSVCDMCVCVCVCVCV